MLGVESRFVKQDLYILSCRHGASALEIDNVQACPH